MKFTEKVKRFFTLSAKHEGFTLVELIVVIAILAILAGVAVPAYSGYIKKANRAGDETLLRAVNEAFAAAMIKSGSDSYLVSYADVEWDSTGRKAVTGISAVSVTAGSVDLADVNAAFDTFFSGNEGSEFKVIEKIVFDISKFMFVDLESAESIGVSYAGSVITVSGSALQALKNSTFGQNIGSAALLDQVGKVTAVAQTMADSLDVVFNDSAFLQAAMAATGSSTEEEHNAKTEAMVQQLVAGGMDPTDAYNQVCANAAVLYASQKAVTYTDDQIAAIFSGNSATIKNNLKTDGQTADGMAQAALVYGMYTAYANSSEYGSSTLQKNAEDPILVLEALDNDPNFINYVKSDQGKTDLAAYQSALGIIVDSTSNNEDATTDLMLNGFNNDELKNIIGGLMG